MTTPWIILCQRNHARSYRVQVQVCRQLQEVAVQIGHNRLVTSLQELPNSLLSPVDPAGLTKGKVLHDARKRNYADLYGERDRVVHQTEDMDRAMVTFSALLEEEIKTITVVIVIKGAYATIATQHDLIKSGGIGGCEVYGPWR